MIASSDDLAHLIERVAQRDRSAFAALHSATRGKLLKSAVLIVRNRDDADDVVQETYLKVWMRALSYRRSAFSPISWLVAITRNQALDHLRRRHLPQVEISAADSVVDTGANPEQIAIRRNMSRIIHGHITALPELKREAVAAAFLQDLTYPEIATAQNVPLNTAKTRVHRAIDHLRQRLPPSFAEAW